MPKLEGLRMHVSGLDERQLLDLLKKYTWETQEGNKIVLLILEKLIENQTKE